MKKTTLIAFLLAMLAPMTQVWAGSNYYASLTTTVKSGSGKVYAANSSTAEADRSYNTTSSTSSTLETSTSGGSVSGFYAYAKPDTGWKFVKWTNTSGTTLSTSAEYGSISLNASTTKDGTQTTEYWAYFEKEVLPSFNITFETSSAGSYTVDGAAPVNKTGLTEATSVTLASSDPNFLNWLVNGTVVAANPYTTSYIENTTISAEFLTADQVAAVTSLSELSAALANSAYRKVYIPMEAEIVMTSGTISVPSEKQLVVDGKLWVEGGSITASGKVVINGTLSKCTKLIQQTGNNGQPFNPYEGDEKYQVKYWKTTITTPSITMSGVNASSHASIVNGLGETVYRGATANAFVCTTDKSVAINHITGVKASYSSGTDAYNAVAKNSHNVSQTTCNLMGSAASELVLLTAAGSVSVGSSTALTSGFIADCAGNNISFTSKQFSNAANVITINGATVSSSKLTNARLTAINCTTVNGAGTDGINSNQASYYTSLHLYDCRSFSSFNFSKSNVIMEEGTPGVCFFSGGPYSPSFTGNYHVYGGTFSKDPTNYLASNDLEAPKEGSYWVVHRIVPTINVAKVGSTEYESLQEAVNAAATSSGTVELLPGIAEIELETPVMVAVGKTVTIDLAGYAITAPNGAIVNNGTLYLQDTSTFDVPGSITTASGNMIVNNGTLDVTYGAYAGNIQLNGGTFTTHFGTFDGDISVANGLDPKVVANLRGGEFSKSVSAFLRDGYTEVYSHIGQNDPMRYWIFNCLTIVTSTSYSSTEKAWKLDFMTSSDLALYKKEKKRSVHSSLADWQRRAELHSYVQPYSQYVLDCALIFDRAVDSGSVTFYGNVQVSMSESVGKDLAANEDFPVLAHRIYEMGYTPLSYGRYIDEIGSVTAGVKNNQTANVGTVCTIDVRVCTQSKQTPGVYDKLQALVDVRYMLGGKKAAIDRNGSRLAYDSLSAAVSAAQDGETILVGADTDNNVTLPGPGEFTIDPYGFQFTGMVSAPSGYAIVAQTEKNSLAAAQGVESAKAVTYVVLQPPEVTGTTGAGTIEVSGLGAPTGYSVTSYKIGDESVATPQLSLPSSGYETTQLKAVVRTAAGNVVDVDVVHNIGVLKVESTAETTVIAVPWYAFDDDGTTVKVDSLVYLGNRDVDDMLKAYNSDTGNYDSWKLTEKDGVKAWSPMITVGDTTTEAGDASVVSVTRGQGLLLTRKDVTKPIYLVGRADGTATKVVSLAKGMNLVASPSLVGLDLNAAFASPGSDEIVVPTAGAPKTYTYADGAWGYEDVKTETRTIRGQTVTVVTGTERKTDALIPPGRGFLYINRADGEKSVVW